LYYEATNFGGELLCVSPGNTIPTHFDKDANNNDVIQQDKGLRCPGTFQPSRDNRFRNKLTFSFAIGQAF
jgi:hypothetical protein